MRRGARAAGGAAVSAHARWRVSWRHTPATETYDTYEDAAAAVRAVASRAVGECVPEGPTEVWWRSPEDREAEGDGEDPYVRVLATIARCEEAQP